MCKGNATQRTIHRHAVNGDPMIGGRDRHGEPVWVEIPNGCPLPPSWPPPDDFWDIVVVGFSNGADSRALLLEATERFGTRTRAVYNILGDEHPGSIYEANNICKGLGVPLIYTWKDEQLRSCYGVDGPEHPIDLMLYLVERYAVRVARLVEEGRPVPPSAWPGGEGGSRFCSSEGKAGPTDVVLKAIPSAWPGGEARGRFCSDRGKAKLPDTWLRSLSGRRILFLTGERAAESRERRHHPEWKSRIATPTLSRLVLWHRMIKRWADEDVLERIAAAGLDLPESYSQGWKRHGCALCPTKTASEQVLGFYYFWERAAARADLEERTTPVSQKYHYEGTVGYRAIWERTYGPWNGIPNERPPLLPGAAILIESMKRERPTPAPSCPALAV